MRTSFSIKLKNNTSWYYIVLNYLDFFRYTSNIIIWCNNIGIEQRFPNSGLQPDAGSGTSLYIHGDPVSGCGNRKRLGTTDIKFMEVMCKEVLFVSVAGLVTTKPVQTAFQLVKQSTVHNQTLRINLVRKSETYLCICIYS